MESSTRPGYGWSVSVQRIYRDEMDYEVKSLSQFGVARTALALQGFLNGWVTGNGYEVVSVLDTEDDWLVVVKKS